MNLRTARKAVVIVKYEVEFRLESHQEMRIRAELARPGQLGHEAKVTFSPQGRRGTEVCVQVLPLVDPWRVIDAIERAIDVLDPPCDTQILYDRM